MPSSMEAVAYPVFRAVLIGNGNSGKDELCDTFVNNISRNQVSSFGGLPGSKNARQATKRGRLRSRFHLKHVALRHLQTGPALPRASRPGREKKELGGKIRGAGSAKESLSSSLLLAASTTAAAPSSRGPKRPKLKLLAVVDEKAFKVEPTGGWDLEIEVDEDTTVKELFEVIKAQVRDQ